MNNVLHISKYYAPVDGGIEKICKLVVDSLTNFNQEVICFNSNGITEVDTVDGILIHRLGSDFQFSSQHISISYFFYLKSLLRRFMPDVIHFHAPNPLIMFYILLLIPKSCRLIVHWHSDIIEQKVLYKLIHPIEKRMLERADVIIATSDMYAKHSLPLSDYYDKIEIIPCAIDDVLFNKEVDDLKVESIRQFYNNVPIIFFVGRHVHYKGLRYLLDAERLIKQDCVILIGGAGPLSSSLQQSVDSSRIKFLGRLDEDELLMYYHACSIFTLPSITKNEAFGLVLAEAMLCSKPLVTFKIQGSGVNWVNIHMETGLEVENRSIEGLAMALDKLLSEPDLRDHLGKGGFNRVHEKFVKSKIEPLIVNLYSKLLS